MTDEAKALVELMRDRVVYDSRHYIPDPLLSAGADLIETQAREIERLREALTRISNLSPAVTHGWAEEARQIARAALAGDSHV